MIKRLTATFIFILALLAFKEAEAAKFLLNPASGTLNLNQLFNVEIKISTETQESLNAAQATINFPPRLLSVEKIDREDSVFRFWLQEPKFDNEAGAISFIGGTTGGVSGASLGVLKITFRTKAVGSAELFFNDSAITANDGRGTNILTEAEGSAFAISELIAPVVPVALTSPGAVIEIPKPTPIVRKSAPAKKLPERPAPDVPLYPDASAWYNISAPFLAKWTLPDDVDGVSTLISRGSTAIPPPSSDGLFDNKIFAPLGDGISYLHIRFRNNVGWGPTAHYRLAIDTKPPIPFSIFILEGSPTDQPKLTITFPTGDELSGIKEYLVKIDDGEFVSTDHSFLISPLQKPGKHSVLVRAVDHAKNFSENNLEIEILPIASPLITSISRDVFVGEGELEISGITIPNASIILLVKRNSGRIIFSTTVNADVNGSWEVKIDQPLKKGKYFVEATAQDARGALSLPTQSDLIRVRERPLLTIAGFEITQFWFFIGLLSILLFGFAIGWFSYSAWRRQLNRRAIIAQRDVANLFATIKQDLEKVLASYADKRLDQREISEIEFIINRLKDNLEKAQNHVLENIKEISK